MSKVYPIQSKYENVTEMFAKCTGHVNTKNESTTATQSPSGVNKAIRIDKRVGMIL